MDTTKVRPYLFILLVFAIPLLLIPAIKMAKNDSQLLQEPPAQTQKDTLRGDYAIIIHGGAGNFTADDLSEAEKLAYKKALFEALESGKSMLSSGKEAVYVVENVINMLEDDSLFNAGKGAVLTHEGHAELDASIMRGQDRNAGAVAGVRTTRNPISAARMVMDSSVHVLLSGRGAEAFSRTVDLKQVDNSYFITKKSQKRLKVSIDKHGTVGCAVIDTHGNLAAGTSTGGMNNKRYGRIGDSPIIGAGTWADNQTCAISATGWGEYFIRLGVAHEISALMRYKEVSLEGAAHEVINKQLEQLGGYGGIIGVDAFGNVSAVFNTTGMYRAYYDAQGKQEIKMFND